MHTNYSNLVFFPYSTMDYPTIMHWLEEKLTQGWLLEKFYPTYCAAKFKKTDTTGIRYGIELNKVDGIYGAKNSPPYLSYFEEKESQQWHYIDSMNDFHLFYQSSGQADSHKKILPMNESSKSITRYLLQQEILPPLLLLIFPLTVLWLNYLSTSNLDSSLSFLFSYPPLVLCFQIWILCIITHLCYLGFRFYENKGFILNNTPLLSSNHPILSYIPLATSTVALLGFCAMVLHLRMDYSIFIRAACPILFLLLINPLFNHYQSQNHKPHKDNCFARVLFFALELLILIPFIIVIINTITLYASL